MLNFLKFLRKLQSSVGCHPREGGDPGKRRKNNRIYDDKKQKCNEATILSKYGNKNFYFNSLLDPRLRGDDTGGGFLQFTRFFIVTLTMIIILGINESASANKYYDHLKLTTLRAPNDNIYYTIHGFLNGEDQGILQEGTAANTEEAEEIKNKLRQKYNIQEGPRILPLKE